MKYIKNFNTNEELLLYKKSNFITPQLYLSKQNKNVYYKEKYIELEYISSTVSGGQYIDLGCKLMETTTDVEINIKFKIKGPGKNNSIYSTLLNAMQEIKPWPGFTIRQYESTNNIQIVCKHEFTGYNEHSESSYNYFYNDKLNSFINCNITIDNIPNDCLHNVTTTLFCSLDENLNTWRYCEADLYKLKITKGNTVIRNLIPAKKSSTNEVGLYDIENDKFYISQGDNPFVAGPVKVRANEYYDAEIEYLQNSSIYEYIDTGISTYNSMIGIDCVINLGDYEHDKWVLGYNNYQGADTGGFQIGLYSDQLYASMYNSYKTVGSFVKINYDNTNKNDWYHIIMNCLDTVVDINNNLSSNTQIYDFGINGGNIYLYGRNGSLDHSQYVKVGSKIASCKLYKDNNILVRDFIPVRKDGVGYMFDKVTKQLFGNNGTGEFILGPDK